MSNQSTHIQNKQHGQKTSQNSVLKKCQNHLPSFAVPLGAKNVGLVGYELDHWAKITSFLGEPLWIYVSDPYAGAI